LLSGLSTCRETAHRSTPVFQNAQSLLNVAVKLNFLYSFLPLTLTKSKYRPKLLTCDMRHNAVPVVKQRPTPEKSLMLPSSRPDEPTTSLIIYKSTARHIPSLAKLREQFSNCLQLALVITLQPDTILGPILNIRPPDKLVKGATP